MMIRWAMVYISLLPTSVSLGHIYDSPDDCSAQTMHVHFFGSEGYAKCVEIDGDKSPEPQIQKARPSDEEAASMAKMLKQWRKR